MQEYLVNIKISWPSGITEEELAQLTVTEREMAKKRSQEGHLVRMWRVPGRRENWGLWRAKDTSELHEIISQLPVWPYMDVSVHALADHPVDPK